MIAQIRREALASARLDGETRSMPTTHEQLARQYIEDIARLSQEQYDGSQLVVTMKAARDSVKANILAENSADDPRALGANAELRAATVERIYLDEMNGQKRDDDIAQMVRENALRQIEIDRLRSLLRLELILLEIPEEHV